MSFQELCDRLPICPGRQGLPILEVSGGLAYVETGLPEFVGPDLTVSVASEQQPKPSIIIISAAGAVGKSTLAREIAFRKRAPIWDLAQAKAVGAKSVAGELTSSLGFSGAANASQFLSSGSLMLIVDALDEARVKANEAGYEAFVDDIASIAKGASGTAFVLLGRTLTAETTWLLLQEAGVSASLLAIQPFTRVQAEKYIELRIKQIDMSAAKRIEDHRQPFIEARNLIFDHLERAVGGGEEGLTEEAAREFLGYAPVLETVAVLLAKETNYSDFIANLGGRLTEHPAKELDRPLAVLHHVVTRLLEREQEEKLVRNIKPALETVAAEHDWNSWDRLYSPAEQRLRLLGRILGSTFQSAPLMPPAVRARYEEQLEAWLPEHPFLREGREPANKVFESYLFAGALREYLTEMSRAVEQRVSAVDYKPSRLLADFYILLGPQNGEDPVPEKHIGLLYDSLVSGENDSLRVRLSVEAGDPDDEDDDESSNDGEFELIYSAPGAEEGERVESRSFTIVQGTDGIAFRRQLKDATIVANGRVVLGGDVDDFEIGPSVDIRCKKLSIHSRGLVVRAGRGGDSDRTSVVLEAANCQSTVARKPLVRGSLHVSWPNAEAYPWTDYATLARGVEGGNQRMDAVYRRFRRIATSLRSHSKGSLARLRDKVEHRRILKGKSGKMLLAKLNSDGILFLKGKFYHWSPDAADVLLKVSWNDLRHRKASAQLTKYLEEFLTKNPTLFVQE